MIEEEEVVINNRSQHVLDHHNLQTSFCKINYDAAVTQILFPTSTGSQQLFTTVQKSRESVMSDIEDTIEQIITSIMIGEPIKLPFLTRKLGSTQQHKKEKEDINNDLNPHYNTTEEVVNNVRYLSLSNAVSTKALARYISVLQMIYEAIAYRIMVTKRDMFYRDVPLFGTQAVSAASKGLVFGPIRIRLKNNKIMDCMSIHEEEDDCHDQGMLIPPIHQILEIQSKASCMIVVEKEGKGYPDLCTRQFIKHFSTCYSSKPILALMDNDPHGLDIYATYKWGARVTIVNTSNIFIYLSLYIYIYRLWRLMS
ncbi:Spo11/DNA topoisomerase VI subunit A [Cokeromyces recurvatus]|uniref:Spo11/DNA topoisomerase VI subunit A n=1 Tax=Cokeromyces recurvatus TaxID=90255 RepID=UPI0022207E97|nr:Spo11/DNA topoisomerase VI subunit A [Cokeromyces recurvatus]KAI7904690.1 Spo11/DNA topoisomerase VI subunit A [Cokeromyces recurvatus]